MLVHGRPRGRDRPEQQKYWQFLYKATTPVSATTTSALATANTLCLSAGIQLTLPANWALHVVNYYTDAVDQSSTGFLFANTAQFEIQYPSTFGIANARKLIPLLNEMGSNFTAQATSGGGLGTISSAGPPPSGVVAADWTEFDDIDPAETPVPSIVQIQAAWLIFNTDSGAHNIIIHERIAYEVWQLTLLPAGVKTRRDIADIRAAQGYGY